MIWALWHYKVWLVCLFFTPRSTEATTCRFLAYCFIIKLVNLVWKHFKCQFPYSKVHDRKPAAEPYTKSSIRRFFFFFFLKLPTMITKMWNEFNQCSIVLTSLQTVWNCTCETPKRLFMWSEYFAADSFRNIQFCCSSCSLKFPF